MDHNKYKKENKTLRQQFENVRKEHDEAKVFISISFFTQLFY